MTQNDANTYYVFVADFSKCSVLPKCEYGTLIQYIGKLPSKSKYNDIQDLGVIL